MIEFQVHFDKNTVEIIEMGNCTRMRMLHACFPASNQRRPCWHQNTRQKQYMSSRRPFAETRMTGQKWIYYYYAREGDHIQEGPDRGNSSFLLLQLSLKMRDLRDMAHSSLNSSEMRTVCLIPHRWEEHRAATDGNIIHLTSSVSRFL